MSGLDSDPDPSVPGTGGSGAGRDAAAGRPDDGTAGDAGPDDEVLEILDVDDEMAAMAAAFGDRTGAGGATASDTAASDPATSDTAASDTATSDTATSDTATSDPAATELGAARRERDDYLDALRRLQADFENYKKRVAKQQADVAGRAASSLAEKLLPALDTADLAMAHGGGEEVKQVWSALLDALGNEGLERIAPEGGPFDPNRHDAVAHEPGDGDQEVAEVLRAGYAWKGRVLRPAMVKVRG